ncbi:multiple epidermal growth factor-like domains protein 10 [Haliotis rufescens]|uniref:multiple epidermal growth factor-like domains protein 10 n=1 Tax=Haliotis rufescens TaxID=6454 RepID=UPI00201EEF23|nr:multiple epidermal growth factor-like domains protein 10 [Haliotis rufescens]
MAGVRTLLVWIVVAECWIQLIKGSCPAGKFGDLCSYFCHCGNDCNRTTGVCSKVCDKGWVGGHGKTCQKENVAYNKNATTPSGLYHHDPPWSADKAVDGNRDQDVFHNSCFHAGRYPSVWKVDLGQPYKIHDVRIYNRAKYILRIRTAALSVSNTRSTTSIVPCYTFPSNTTKGNSVYDVTCDAIGQYVTIKHGTETLNLCEVEIYVCSQGTFGADCNNFCHCSVGPCDRVSGFCTGNCRPGWQGQSCSVECDRDHYGVNCDETCGNRKCAADTPSQIDLKLVVEH